MFKFFKDKLKGAVEKFSKSVDEEGEDIETTEDEVVDTKIFDKEHEQEKETIEPVELPVDDAPKEEESVPEPIEEVKEEPVLDKTTQEKEEVAEEQLTEETSEEIIEPVKEITTEKTSSKEVAKEKKEEANPETTAEHTVEEKEEDEEPSETFLLDNETEETQSAQSILEEVALEEAEEDDKHEVKLAPIEEPKKPEPIAEKPKAPEPKEEIKEEKGFFGKLLAKKIDDDKFEALFFELEVILLENNVSVQVIDKIKADMKEEIVGKPLKRSKILDIIQETLGKSIKEVLTIDHTPFDQLIETKQPYVVCLLGINGSGKTTSIAKLASRLKDQGKTVVLAAADTFRAAAIDQLQEHANNLGLKLIKHDYGSDPAAVAFDAIEHAKAKKIDVVLIDTAGRIHSNTNLMNEMKKIIKVSNPDLKIFVGESITGNDCVMQANAFNEAVGIGGIILSKADIDEKGGAAISVSYVTKSPIFYIGTGQEYEDLEVFDPNKVLKTLGL